MTYHPLTAYKGKENYIFVSYAHKDGSVVLQYTVRSQAPHPGRRVKLEDNNFKVTDDSRELGENDFHFVSNRIYTIYPDGSIELNSAITGNKNIDLARTGYQMRLPPTLKTTHTTAVAPGTTTTTVAPLLLSSNTRALLPTSSFISPNPRIWVTARVSVGLLSQTTQVMVCSSFQPRDFLQPLFLGTM